MEGANFSLFKLVPLKSTAAAEENSLEERQQRDYPSEAKQIEILVEKLENATKLISEAKTILAAKWTQQEIVQKLEKLFNAAEKASPKQAVEQETAAAADESDQNLRKLQTDRNWIHLERCFARE